MHDKQILYSLRVGDGGFITQSTGDRFGTKNYYLQCSSSNLDYISFKKSLLENLGITVRPLRTQKSGYKSDSLIYCFGTRNHQLISEVGNMTIIDVVNSLNKEGLIYFFLDDGTYHQRKHFGHIYCNTFSEEEVQALIKIMYKFYPQKECKKRLDRKKDGREYPYIYIPVVVMDEFKKDIKEFLVSNYIESLYYKVGGIRNEDSSKI